MTIHFGFVLSLLYLIAVFFRLERFTEWHDLLTTLHYFSFGVVSASVYSASS